MVTALAVKGRQGSGGVIRHTSLPLTAADDLALYRHLDAHEVLLSTILQTIQTGVFRGFGGAGMTSEYQLS